MITRSILSTVAALAMTTALSAQTVTVNSGGGADHTDISSAIAAVKANAATPDVINITGGGPYNEALLIDSSVSIVGDGFTPIIVSPGISGAAASSLNGRAVGITTSTGNVDVVLENLIIIPQVGSAVTRGVFTNNNTGEAGISTDNMTVVIQDCVITGNDGSDNPVTTDGLTQNISTSHTYFTDDLVFFTGLITDATVNNSVISHGLGQGGGTTPDGIVFFPDSGANTLNIGAGTVISYIGRIGVQVAADESSANIQGTSGDPVYILETGLAGLSPINGVTISGNANNGALAIFHDNNSNTSTAYDIDYLTVAGGPHSGIRGLFVDDADSFPAIDMDHVIVTNMGADGFSLGDDANQPINIANSTIVGNGGFPFVIGVGGGTSDATVTANNVIIAGNGTADASNSVFATAGTSLTINITDSGLPTFGAFGLSSATTNDGTSTFNLTDVINDDPLFPNPSNPFAANFIDVSGPAYETGAGGGGFITGAGTFIFPSSADSAWTMYQ